MKESSCTLFLLVFLVCLMTAGCCSRDQKKKDILKKDPALRDSIVRLYIEDFEDGKALKSGENRFIAWEKRKNMLKYSVKKAHVRKDFHKIEARKNKYYKEAMKLVAGNKLKKAMRELKKADSSLANNTFVKKIMRTVEMKYYKNEAFNNESLRNSSSAIISGGYSRAKKNADRIIRKNRNSRNLFLLRDAYRIKYKAEALENNLIESKNAYTNYLRIDKKIRENYYGQK